MKKIAVVLFTMLALVGAATIVTAVDNGPATISIDKVKKSMAAVEFQHHEHQKRAGDCKVCHHKAADQPKACSECHGKDDAAPKYKDAMHKKCKSCHKTEAAAGKKAPTKCNGCHVK